MRDLKGKTAFVTGGGSGIGLALATAFLREGMQVAVADIRQDHLDQAATALKPFGDAVRFLRLDVMDRAAMAAAADETERAFGKVHVLCNNAGISNRLDIDAASYADWDWVLGVNLGGVINGLVSFLPKLKAHGEGGHVVNTGSIASLIPRQGRAGVYTTSKFALLGLTASLRFNLAPDGIGVTLLCPGLTRTKIAESEMTRPAHLRSPVAPPPRENFGSSPGTDPADVAEMTLQAIRNNEPYVLAIPMMFNDEVREFFSEIAAALPQSEKPWPGQKEYEDLRRKMIAEGKARLQPK